MLLLAVALLAGLSAGCIRYSKAKLYLKGHTDYLWCMAYSPDGKRIVSGGQDQTLRVWDALTGEELLVITGHSRRVASVAISPDGKRIVSSSDDDTLRVWDAATGKEALRLEGAMKGATSLKYSPDGEMIAAAGDGKKVRLWDARTGKERPALLGAKNSIYRLSFSPKGKCLAGCGRGRIVVWDVRMGKVVLTIEGEPCVQDVAYSQDGKHLASCGDKRCDEEANWAPDIGVVKIWDADTGKEFFAFEGAGSFGHIAYSPDGQLIITGDELGALIVWDAKTGEQKLVFHGSGMREIAFSPDGEHVAGAEAKTVKVWSVAAAK
jgi:WD40 repeat protein